jgi:2-polyprenyl-3-methyl-5-hydroxy-6-metoxy-1,4-benzoquinol methylase
VLGYVEDQVVDAFRHGKGVPYSAYNRFHEVMAEESGQTVVAALHEHILPVVPGLPARLAKGIEVLDIACGSGLAMIELAKTYPASRFAGYDASEHAIAAARREAARHGLANVRFEVRDVAAINEPGRYDLVTGFDAIHDQAKPAQVLREIRTALKPGGTFLMQDILACSHVHGNRDNPMAPFIYTISCFHCMSVSLANGGPGLGRGVGQGDGPRDARRGRVRERHRPDASARHHELLLRGQARADPVGARTHGAVKTRRREGEHEKRFRSLPDRGVDLRAFVSCSCLPAAPVDGTGRSVIWCPSA